MAEFVFNNFEEDFPLVLFQKSWFKCVKNVG